VSNEIYTKIIEKIKEEEQAKVKLYDGSSFYLTEEMQKGKTFYAKAFKCSKEKKKYIIYLDEIKLLIDDNL
jgi:hypothetical protein